MRITLGVTTILLLALAAGVAWAVSSGAAAELVRARVGDEATRAFGRAVHIDQIGGDPWRGFALRGVRIAGPAGSAHPLLEAPRIRVSVDAGRLIADLIGGRGVLSSLRRIEIERPILTLSRNAAGGWNYAGLLGRPGGPAAAAPSFRALVEIHEGRILFSDALRLRQRAGARPPSAFSARFDRVTGRLDFTAAPLLSIVLDAIHTDGRTPALLHVAGRAALGAGTFDVDLDARGGAVAVWGPYLVRLPWLAWGGGTFDSTMHLLASRWGGQIVWDYRGSVRLRDGRVRLLPRRTLLSDIDGVLAVDNLGVTTAGVSMAVDGSPIAAQGRIMYEGGTALDLAVRSHALNLRTLQRVLFPRAQVRLSGRARGEARITGSLGSPRVAGTIDRAAGAINRESFADLSGRFQYYGGLLSFDHLAAAAGGGRVDGHLRLDVGSGTFLLLADARNVDLRVLDRVGLPAAPPVSGAASGYLTALRTRQGLIAQGRFQLGVGAAYGVAFDRADGIFGYDLGRLEVDRFEARSRTMRLHGFGEMSRSGALDFTVAGMDADLGLLGARLGLQRWLAGTADLFGRLEGTLRSPRLGGQVFGRDGRLGPLPFDLARGRIELTRTSLRTPGVVLFDGDGRYSAAGLIRWGEPPRVDLVARAENVAAQRLFRIAAVPIRAEGTVEAAVRVTGPILHPTAQGVVELRDGHIEGQPLDRATVAFRWTGSQLRIGDLSAAVNGSTLRASGTISRTGGLGISFSASKMDLADIAALRRDVLRLSGTADLTGRVTGTLRVPAIAATATSGDLMLNGQVFDQARGQVSYNRGRLTLAPLLLRQRSGSFELNGTVVLRDEPMVDLRITAAQGELATLVGLARVRSPFPLRGTLDGEVTAAGSIRNPRASLDLRLTDGRLGDEPIQEAVVRADLADQAVELDTLRVTPSRGELVGAGRINLRGRSEVEFGGSGVDLNLLRPLFNVQRPLAGSLDFTLQLTGELNDPLVGLSAAVTDGGIGMMSFDRITLQAFYRGGQFNIEHAVIQEDRHRVEVAGSLPFNPARMRLDESRPVNLRLELVDSDLSILGVLSDRIERAEGVLAGAVSITGTAAQPDLDGEVHAAGGTIKLRGVDPALTDLQAKLTFTEDALRVESFQARAGSGTVGAAGSVGFSRFRPDALDLTVTSNGARIVLPGLYSGQVDGSVHVVGAPAAPEIGGAVTLSGGDIAVSAAQRVAARPANGPPGSGPQLNLDARAGDALWVNVGGLRFQVGGGVHASGSGSSPRLSGEVVAERGAFVAFNTTFRLVEGRATFTEFRGMTPYVDAIAETRVSVPQGRTAGGRPAEFVRATVRLHVTGTPDALELGLTSDPPLPRNELIAALGRQSGFAAIFAGGAELESALLQELSNALFGQVGLAVAGALGLEEVTLEYDTERQFTLRIGTLLIENLYLTWTSEFGTPRRSIWALEYRLSPSTRVSFSVDSLARYSFLYRVTYLY